MTEDDDRIQILKKEVLLDEWSVVTKYTIDYRRGDGRHETQIRQVYDRGDGAALLPYDPGRGRVLLVRQFRMPAWVNGKNGMLIEACAGLLDRQDPESCIRKEAEEELGYRIGRPRLVFSPYTSPGSVSERLYCFIAEYSPADRISRGGGSEHEGEDIEVLEIDAREALGMIADGRIIDAKTIMLLQYARLEKLI
ncbi:MAG: NUDIX domain-containing protein [Rhizobiales bacterium]|nr:NUDIX domain-containing protein [Hyphomicrobiales bacterium]